MSRASIRRATRSSDLGKLMRQAAGRHQLWDVFADFVEMAALSVANACDIAQRPAREARYMRIIGKYEKAEQELFPQMLAALVERMEEGPADVLGALFGELELGNSDRGQFFTPYEVCRLMARMQIGDAATLKATVASQGFVTVNEPACGAGAMIIAFSEAMREAGVEPQQHMHATCQDIDVRGVHMCYLQLALLHIPAVVVLGNTLTVEVREVWYTPAHILGGWTWRLKRGRHPLLEPANDNAPAEPERVRAADPRSELEAAKNNPEGQELSPEAQALYEQEGAERFAKHHPKLAKATLEPHPHWPFQSGKADTPKPPDPPASLADQLALF